MVSVLRATALLATVAVLASAGPAPAQAGPADAAAPAAPEVFELASCADGIGGRWIAEKAGWRETNELRLVHVGSDGVRAAAVSVRQAGASRGLAAQLRCDGRGGAWLVWTEIDYLGMTTDVRAAHVNRDGALRSRGDAVLASFFDLFDAVSLLADGRGGAYVAWREADGNHERRLRLCRLDEAGRAASGWPANGILLDEPRGNVRPHLVTDGEGGAIVVGDPDPNQPGSQAFALRVSPGAALLR